LFLPFPFLFYLNVSKIRYINALILNPRIMSKKYFIHVLALAFILANTINFVFAQNASQLEQVYQVSFEPIGQQEVKPLIGMLMPLFNQVPYIEQGKYENFYYKVTGNIEPADVRHLLQNSKYILLDISILDKKSYDKMTNQNLNLKN